MKRIKSGIRKDFNMIPLKSKEETLASAGLSFEKTSYRFNIARLLPAVAACAVIISLCTSLALALGYDGESGGIITQIKSIFKEESQAESRRHTEDGFRIMLNYSADDGTEHEPISYYRSVKDIIADLGDGLYYSAYETYENDTFASVMYRGGKYYNEQTGETEESYTVQIDYYYNETGYNFWIHLGFVKEDWMYDPNAEIYKCHGTDFYIGEYSEEFNGCFVEGALEGNSYSFIAKDKAEAKAIIDSFTKSE